MSPIQTDTTYSLVGNKFNITEYKTRTFDNGLKVQDVERRTYTIMLYDSSGMLTQHTNKGNSIDMMA